MKDDRIIDVFCVGMTPYDISLSVDYHPLPDDKIYANDMVFCGGGPASNAAATVARLGGRSAICGYLGNDIFGDIHIRELVKDKVITDYIIRGNDPTKISIIMIKKDGTRSIITYDKKTPFISPDKLNFDFSKVKIKAMLFDGHEPEISIILAKEAKKLNIPIVLDAGSIHKGTELLIKYTDYLVCSEKFIRQYNDKKSIDENMNELLNYSSYVAATFGGKGIKWKTRENSGSIKAYKIDVVDTTGAGDVFHGAFAYSVARGSDFIKSLNYANAAAALCCTKLGARLAIPDEREIEEFLKSVR